MDQNQQPTAVNNEIVELYLDDIIPNRFQPRETFDERALNELSMSIKEHGVIQPIIVRKIQDKYEIIAGERRYKASAMAGLTKIPAIIRNLDDKETSKVALLENLQRRDLSAIEEARTYQKILDLDQMTQYELAQTMGKSQPSIANKLRLLTLPDEVQDALLNGKISERHARSLLNIPSKQEQVEMLHQIIDNKLTVRDLENKIKNIDNSNTEFPGLETIEPVNNNINNQNMNLTTNQVNYSQNSQANNNQMTFQPKQSLDNIKPVIPESKNLTASTTNIPKEPNFESKVVPKIEPKQEPIEQMPTIETTSQSSSNNSIEELELIDDNSDIEVLSSDNKLTPITKVEEMTEELAPINKETVTPSALSIDEPNKTVEEPKPIVNNYRLNKAINQIRDNLRNLEDDGFVINTDEIDLDNEYQITIKITKK